jgi:hypothetical protein
VTDSGGQYISVIRRRVVVCDSRACDSRACESCACVLVVVVVVWSCFTRVPRSSRRRLVCVWLWMAGCLLEDGCQVMCRDSVLPFDELRGARAGII